MRCSATGFLPERVVGHLEPVPLHFQLAGYPATVSKENTEVIPGCEITYDNAAYRRFEFGFEI
jgi:hypothetical protein